MKKALLGLFVFLLTFALWGSDILDGIPFRLFENENHWRIQRISTNSSGWPGGESSNSQTNYYYNTDFPSEYDSVVVVVSGQFYSTYRSIYTRIYNPDTYEVIKEDYISYWDDLSELVGRETRRYNYSNKLLEYVQYHSTEIGLVVFNRTMYVYNANGFIEEELVFSAQDLLLSKIVSSYTPNNLLATQDKYNWNSQANQLVQNFHESRFYSQSATPDSIHWWQINYGNAQSYRLYNYFNEQGMVYHSETHTNNTIEKRFTDFVFGENRYFTSNIRTYKHINISTNPTISDSTLTAYTYSPNFRNQTQRFYQNGTQLSVSNYVYNDNWCMTNHSSSYNYGTYGSNSSSTIVWESYTDVMDDYIVPSAITVRVYPNPAHNSAKLVYKLSEPAVTNLSIYNLKGQLVFKINMGAQTAGENSFNLPDFGANGLGLSSGIYLVRVDTGKSSQTTRFVVMK